MTKEQLFNPDKVTRNFCQPITFIPGGDGLLLDRRVLLFTAYRPRNAQTVLNVVIARDVPVVWQKRLERGFTLRGDINYLGKSIIRTGIHLDRGARSKIYIGYEYEITFMDFSSKSTTAEIRFAQPLQIEQVNPRLSFREFFRLVRENLGSR